jgi:hypothetical protein
MPSAARGLDHRGRSGGRVGRGRQRGIGTVAARMCFVVPDARSQGGDLLLQGGNEGVTLSAPGTSRSLHTLSLGIRSPGSCANFG